MMKKLCLSFVFVAVASMCFTNCHRVKDDEGSENKKAAVRNGLGENNLMRKIQKARDLSNLSDEQTALSPEQAWPLPACCDSKVSFLQCIIGEVALLD
jgi:hypothetical protein